MGAGGRWQVPRVKVVDIRKSSFVRERRRGSGVENECQVWHPRNEGTHTMLPSHRATPRHALALSLSEIGREMWCGERGRACTAVGEPLLKVFLGKQDGRERKPDHLLKSPFHERVKPYLLSLCPEATKTTSRARP